MAAKCGPDTIYLDGAEGGTGAGPHIAAEETGIPLMAAIPEARRALEDVGLVDEIDLVVAGGIRNGADVAKCLALGAKAVAIGHSALMALNCNKEIPGVTDYEGTVGVPAGRVMSVPEILAHPHLRSRGFIREFAADAGMERQRVTRAGFRLHDADTAPSAPAPVLSAHTREQLAALGYDDAHIDQLRAEGVV